jgi:hypothetical protein
MFVSMTAESRMMPDVERMKEFVADAFGELKQRVPVDIQESHVAEDRVAAA